MDSENRRDMISAGAIQQLSGQGLLYRKESQRAITFHPSHPILDTTSEGRRLVECHQVHVVMNSASWEDVVRRGLFAR